MSWYNLSFSLPKSVDRLGKSVESNVVFIISFVLIVISMSAFYFYFSNGLGLSYNDARSHLDIGRRVVEGLKPGMAQIGSVWLPLPHLLMVPTIWNDFMWHSGLSGAIVSMISYVATGVLIYKFLEKLNVGLLGRLIGVIVFSLNLNVLYLQSTAMTELLLIFTMTAASYYFLLWSQKEEVINLVKTAFWVMMATLVRYDGWFLMVMLIGLILLNIFGLNVLKRGYLTNVLKNYKKSEGLVVFFCTLAGFGIFLWLLWNLLIFGDPLFFAFGPYSAHAQQSQLDQAGDLLTKGDLWGSTVTYFYALFFNINVFITLAGIAGAGVLLFAKDLSSKIRMACLALTAPLIFNIIALFMGHSVLFIQGINGDTWFNVRYGISPISSIAIYIGFLVDRLKMFRFYLIGAIFFVMLFMFANFDAVTIDDARVGSSQKNVSEVSGWLGENAGDKEGFVLISAASHDAIIFSSGLPMKKFIHEGTGKYWESATTNPERWARWIIMRTYDDNDQTWKTVSKTPDINSYTLVKKYPFADIYELKPEFLNNLNTKPSLGKQK